MTPGNLDLTLSIDYLGHDFHVIRVHTVRDPTEMIDDKAGGDLFGMDQFVGEPVSLHHVVLDPESAVSERHGIRAVLAGSP